jgi:RimJ/RimL family protein N-acetyltransferase
MLYGDAIRLRGIERADIPSFVRWFNDPEVRQHMNVFAPMSTAEEERWFETRLERKDEYIFALEVDLEGQWVHIGNAGLHSIDWKNRSAVFGIVIGEKGCWGKGHGTAATRAMLLFAFDELNLNRVELEVFDSNPRARRAYEKAGFRLEGTRRQSHFHHGRYHDAHLMAILREEFLSLGDAGQGQATARL